MSNRDIVGEIFSIESRLFQPLIDRVVKEIASYYTRPKEAEVILRKYLSIAGGIAYFTSSSEFSGRTLMWFYAQQRKMYAGRTLSHYRYRPDLLEFLLEKRGNRSYRIPAQGNKMETLAERDHRAMEPVYVYNPSERSRRRR